MTTPANRVVILDPHTSEPLSNVDVEARKQSDGTIIAVETTNIHGVATFDISVDATFHARTWDTPPGYQVSHARGEPLMNVDYVVDPSGQGTHLALSGASGAFQAALAAGGNRVIWMCAGSSETFSDEEDIGGIAGVITIWGPSTQQDVGDTVAKATRVVLTAAASKNLFKQDSNQDAAERGLIFRNIGFSLGASYAVLLVNAANEIGPFEFFDCLFDDGYLLQNPNSVTPLGNVSLRLRNCGGTLNALWSNNRADLNTGPDQFLSENSTITLTNWFDNSGTGASPDVWYTKNDYWRVANGMVIRETPFFMGNTRIDYSGSGALFSTPGSGAAVGAMSQEDYVFLGIIVRFSHVDGVFGDFQSYNVNNLEGLFIDGVYGYPSGGSPTGTFLTIDTADFLKVYVGDFYGRDFSPQYSGPAITPSAPLATEDFQWTADTELTISGGAITVTQTHHTIDTEGDGATDDLDTINGLVANQLYFFYPAHDARTVVFKHGTGNIECVGNDDIVLDDAHDFVWAFSPDGSTVYVGGDHSSTEIIDADRDTHWRAETAADEDILRATIAGTEHFRVGGTSQLDFFNGSILETTRIVVSSDGATVTLALDQAGGGDLTLVFSDGFSTFDTTPAVTVSLTAGSDTSPQTNYVYILQSNKTLTVSTSGWPSEEHAPIAVVILQSAATTQTENALVVHLWHDHVQGSDEQGHYSHIGRWIRQHSATWESGVAQTLTITTNVGVPDNVDFTTTAGEVYQMHLHTVPAFDTSTGTNVHVVNDSVSPYTAVTDLADLLTDSAGGSMSGKYFNLVLWASVSEETDETHLFINLPSGSYNKQGDATDDVSGFTDFTIPDDFKGTAFLISRLTLRHQAASGGTWTSIQETDLRGLIPNLVAGGGTSAITTEFADNAFKIFDESDVTKLLEFQLSGITTGNTRTLTVPDGDGTLILATGLAGGQTLIGGTASGEDLTLQSTAHGTRGNIVFDDANFYVSVVSSKPRITLASDAYVEFDRGAHQYSFYANSRETARLLGSGTSNELQLRGDGTNSGRVSILGDVGSGAISVFHPYDSSEPVFSLTSIATGGRLSLGPGGAVATDTVIDRVGVAKWQTSNVIVTGDLFLQSDENAAIAAAENALRIFHWRNIAVIVDSDDNENGVFQILANSATIDGASAIATFAESRIDFWVPAFGHSTLWEAALSNDVTRATSTQNYGTTGIGGSQYAVAADQLDAAKVVLDQGYYSALYIHGRITTAGSAKIRLALYDATGAGGRPGVLLGFTDDITVTNTVADWLTGPLYWQSDENRNYGGVVNLEYGTYWLVVHSEGSAKTFEWDYDAGAAGDSYEGNADTWVDSPGAGYVPEDPWTGGSSESKDFSFYVVGNPAAKLHARLDGTEAKFYYRTSENNLIGPLLGAGDEHDLLGGLTDDDHTQYALLAGRSGGQVLIGGTGSGEDLTLRSNTSDDGDIILGTNCLVVPAGEAALVIIDGNNWTPSSEAGIGEDSGNLYIQSLESMIFVMDVDNNNTNTFLWYRDGDLATGTLLMQLNNAGQLQLPITGSSAGIRFGSSDPVNLYRGAANRLDLATGDSFVILGGAGDFGSPTNGMLWYNTTTGKFRGYESGAWADVVGGGAGGGPEHAEIWGLLPSS